MQSGTNLSVTLVNKLTDMPAIRHSSCCGLYIELCTLPYALELLRIQGLELGILSLHLPVVGFYHGFIPGSLEAAGREIELEV